MKIKKPTFNGKKCSRCGGTRRYCANKNCVHCLAHKAKQRSIDDKTLKPPHLGGNWPRVTTAAGDRVPSDPMVVLMNRKAEKRAA